MERQVVGDSVTKRRKKTGSKRIFLYLRNLGRRGVILDLRTVRVSSWGKVRGIC